MEKNAAREAPRHAKENHRAEIDPVTVQYIMESGDRFYPRIMGGALIIASLGPVHWDL